MNSQWVKYDGSDDQIAEMGEAQYGVLLSNNPSEIVDVSDMVCLPSYLNDQDVNHYLICNPHPLADMICQQARTGQPVWARVYGGVGSQICHEYFPPFAHPDKFEYSFTPFEEEV